MGFNALTREYCDLVEAGVIVPTKVERVALENAASISGLLLTTDCAITEIKKPRREGSCRRAHGLLSSHRWSDVFGRPTSRGPGEKLLNPTNEHTAGLRYPVASMPPDASKSPRGRRSRRDRQPPSLARRCRFAFAHSQPSGQYRVELRPWLSMQQASMRQSSISRHTM